VESIISRGEFTTLGKRGMELEPLEVSVWKILFPKRVILIRSGISKKENMGLLKGHLHRNSLS